MRVPARTTRERMIALASARMKDAEKPSLRVSRHPQHPGLFCVIATPDPWDGTVVDEGELLAFMDQVRDLLASSPRPEADQ